LLLSVSLVFIMTRRPPRSPLSSSSAASDVYKRQPEEVADFDPKPASAAEIIDEPEAEELVTPKQVQALAIALKSAGFSSDEEGKATGRSFIAFLAGRGSLASVKELTRIEAQRVLDRLGSGENGNYRTQEGLVDEALAAWSASKIEAEVVEAEVAGAS